MSCELPTAFSAHEHKARRKHQCCECRGIIEKGETYHTFAGCWEGCWTTYKTCSDCQQLRAEVDKDHHGDEVTPFGYLHETASDEGGALFLRFAEIHLRRNQHPWEWIKPKADAIQERQPNQPPDQPTKSYA